MSKPNVLVLDIETSPHNAYVWNLWNQNVAPMSGQLIKPTKMLTWAAKFTSDKHVFYRTCQDEDFLTLLHELLDEADIVVTFNGMKFDLPHINREFAEVGLRPTYPAAHVDLYTQVKRAFKLPSYRLDYVASVFLGVQKASTGGFELWPAFMAGDEKAKAKMRKYNMQDVKVTQALYKFMLPWIKNHPYAGGIPENFIDDNAEPYECGACQSRSVTLLRPRRTRCYAVRVVQCKKCGSIADGKRRKL